MVVIELIENNDDVHTARPRRVLTALCTSLGDVNGLLMLATCFCSRRVLRLSSGIDVMGPVMWDLALSLTLAWFITFFALFKGIKTSGKVNRRPLRDSVHSA